MISIAVPTPPPPRPGGAVSVPPPGRKIQSRGACYQGPCVTKICHTWGTGVKIGYPPPGLQLCSTNGGAKSDHKGWSGLTPHTGNLLPGTRATTDVLGRRPVKFAPPLGGGGSCPPTPLVPPPHNVLDLTVCKK